MGVVDYLIRRRVKTLEDRWQVFEVTDLVIPAGDAIDQSLGSFEVASWAVGAAFKLYIEFAAPLPAGAQMGIYGQDGPDYETANQLVSAAEQGPSALYSVFATPISTSIFDLLLDTIPNNAPTPALPTIYVVLHGQAAGSAPVEVVRARAAFQVI